MIRMQWKKLGIVYRPNGDMQWAKSHAIVPTPVSLNADTIRVFVTFCDGGGIGRPGYVDVSAKDPTQVRGVSSHPLLDIGRPGAFDDNGLMACSVISLGNGRMYMYYVGFELSHKIRYRMLAGLAISNDNGNTFVRSSSVPVLERSTAEMHVRGGPYCLKEQNLFRLWYVAGSEWTVVAGKPMPIYDIRYLESSDGIHWPAEGEVQLAVSDPDEYGFGRPYVISRPGGGYRMFFSVRRRSLDAYRMGYAESDDGRNWQRQDERLNFDVTAGAHDSVAVMYAAPFALGDQLYMFYNGNDFGREGFAVARLEQS